MKVTVAKIVGSVSGTGWSQVHSFRPEVEEKLASHGELIAAVSFKPKTEIEISSFGSEIIQRLQEIYYSNEAVSVLTKLSQTIETLAAEFLGQVELEVVALVVWQDYLYASRNASGQVWLLRDEALVSLFGGSGLESISGQLQPGDSLAAVSEEFSQLVPEGSLRSALAQETAPAVAETLAAQIHGHEDNGRAAAAIIKTELLSPPFSLPLVRKKLMFKWPAFTVLRVKRPVIFVSGRPGRSRRLNLTVGLVLLAVFVISLVLAGSKKQNEARQRAIRELTETVRYKTDEAFRLEELNPLRAKSLLLESQAAIVEFKQAGGKPDREIADLEEKVASGLERHQREYQAEAVEWYDFDLVKENFRGDQWDLAGTEAVVWGGKQQTAVKLNLETKAAQIVAAGEDLGQVKAVGATEGRAFLTAADKVTVVDTDKAAIVARTAADGWQNVSASRGFGGNLYLLDSAAGGQIWKYLGLDEGLSAKKSYLAGDSFDLSAAVHLAIDGSVWLLFSDGAVVKYTQGKKDAFVIIGLDQPIGEDGKIFTDPEAEHLYILDRVNTRVVVIAKTGEYIAQYHWSGLAGAKDLAVSEVLGKMFFLTGEKVFTIELK